MKKLSWLIILLAVFCLPMSLLIGCSGETQNTSNQNKIEIEYLTQRKSINGRYCSIFVELKVSNNTSNYAQIFKTDFNTVYSYTDYPDEKASVSELDYLSVDNNRVDNFNLNIGESKNITLEFVFLSGSNYRYTFNIYYTKTNELLTSFISTL